MTLENLLIAFAYIVLALIILLAVLAFTAKKYVVWELNNQAKEDQSNFEGRLDKKGLHKFEFETVEGPATLWAINGRNALKKLKKRGLTQIHSNDE